VSTATTSAQVSSVAFSGNNLTDGLLIDIDSSPANHAAKWGGALGTGVTVDYSFPDAGAIWSLDAGHGYGVPPAPGFDPEPLAAHYAQLSAAQQSAVTTALQNWSHVANISFNLVTENNTANGPVGDIRIAITDMEASTYAYTYAPVSGGNNPYGGDLWINYQQPVASGDDYSLGANGYATVLHELGHAIGLDHPFDEFGDSKSGFNSLDSMKFTVMSYSDTIGHSDRGDSSYYPTTPMLYDIQAAQYLYGANMNWAAGNDLYVFEEGQNYYETIWDAGGNDTIQYNSASDGALIDLVAGHFSQLGNAIDLSKQNVPLQNDDVAIAFNVTLENAIGGGGADTLIGNDAANALVGNGGDDSIQGGLGIDTMLGGAGNDIYVVDSAGDVVTENTDEGSDLVKSPVDFTLGPNLENLTLTGSASVNGTGNGAGNVITGNTGNNALEGGAGADQLVGGAGQDTANYSNAAATVTADLGTPANNAGDAAGDTYSSIEDLSGSAFGDVLAGDGSANTVSGNAGDDTLSGAAGNDFLSGNADNDSLDGGPGDDSLVGGAGNDAIVGGDGNDSIIGNAGVEVLDGQAGNDTVHGGPGDDTVSGGTGDDSVVGGTENDFLSGGAGNDILAANVGDDTLDGGAGADQLLGGPGQDFADYRNAAGPVTADLVNPAGNTGDAAGDGYAAIEGIAGSAFGDVLGGDLNANTLSGNAGNDTLSGSDGNDSLSGGDGNDSVIGNADNDALDGGLGDDSLVGGAGNDAIVGGDGNDSIIGNAGVEVLDGQAGNDTVHGGPGDDIVSGGTGDDSVVGGTENDLLFGGDGNDILVGNAGDDTLEGGAGDDQLFGSAGTDLFVFADTLPGQGDTSANGHDTINGGAGDLIDMLDLNDNLQIGGIALSALTADAVIGSALSATTNIAFTAGGVLLIDVNNNHIFDAANDFQITLNGVTSVTYNAADDLFHLA
jgi:Ca2+-binding RTX toxin-like protein